MTDAVPREQRVATADGRTLRVVWDGATSGAAVLVQHGTPGNGALYEPHVRDAASRGLRLVAYDRPGYGESTPHPARRVADCAADVAAIADELRLERLAVWGISGGGPHALACGALLPDRVAAVATLASVAPADADDLDWSAGMGQDNVGEFTAARAGRDALRSFLEPFAAAMTAGTAEDLRAALSTLLTPVDAAALDGDFAAFVHGSSRAALAGGIEGWVEDDLAFVGSWGFAAEDVSVPVLLWHGAHDRFVPLAHGRWLAERLPNVEPRLSPDDGHLTLATRRVPSVHEWLAERLQA